MERRPTFGLASVVNGWRVAGATGEAWAANAGQVLGTSDGRWALVSTSMAALVAGSVAWLASGIMPQSHSNSGRERSLMPYQLFLKLAGRNTLSQVSYSGLGPALGPVSANPSIGNPSALLDHDFADRRAGGSDNDEDTRTITLDRGDTLVGALTEAGVSQEEANAVILALARVYDPKAVRAGETFDISFTTVPVRSVAQIIYTPPAQSMDSVSDDDAGNGTLEAVPETPVGKLLSLSYSPTVDREITIARGATGAFTTQDVHKTLEARFHRAGAQIDSSLYLAAMQAGIPADIVVKMIHMFSYEVDFQRDLKSGDSFEVLYNYYYTPDGQPAKEGDVQYAALNFGGRHVSLYRYRPKGDVPEYFDSRGQSARSMLMKTPVDGARITSGFGMRFHPVLGYSRMHKGVDFGVPIGTPVMAAGAGVIQQEGRLGGYGNFISVNHQNGYSTAYGHLSRFAPGIHVGSRVRQGQVIAYSGNSGMSTGPHLHYEIRIRDAQVNPAAVKIATGRRLFGRDLREFLDDRLHVDSELASMPLENKVAEGGGELRAAKD
ncbi:MAG: M23 family metallopeptidase [Alphaproteobacteria bacterium]|nr:M23 family metallopeptidase [Alphaproteobacteria bacterium]